MRTILKDRKFSVLASLTPALAFMASMVLPLTASASKAAPELPIGQQKEWTLLVFLNGHNNLDSFGAKDINEMEKVGSTDKVHVVVQWASLKGGQTKRLYVTKDNNTGSVTSPVIETLPPVDMGDWRNLVEFARWSAERFPSEKIMVDVWDHGGGWHRRKALGDVAARDISWDDKTGSVITTEQLGDAMLQIAANRGSKVDLYGSDACLMSMAEVASEMRNSVSVFAGSQEVEPGDGWDYGSFLTRWNALEDASALNVGKALADSYKESYSGGSQGTQDVTFSIFDLEKSDALHSSMRTLASNLQKLSSAERRKIVDAARNSQHFTYADYADLIDFLNIVERARITEIDAQSIRGVRDAVSEYVAYNVVSSAYSRAHGVAIWAPYSKSKFNSYATRYRGLEFSKETQWADTLKYILQDVAN